MLNRSCGIILLSACFARDLIVRRFGFNNLSAIATPLDAIASNHLADSLETLSSTENTVLPSEAAKSVWYDRANKRIIGTQLRDDSWIVLRNFLIICNEMKRYNHSLFDNCKECEAIMHNADSNMYEEKSTWVCNDRNFLMIPQTGYYVAIKPSANY